MTSRVESAAATRRALIDAAADLLDAGGPEAVTLREVGARVGVSRNAPYRHFDDKESLLTAVVTEAWDRIAEGLHAVRSMDATPQTRLRHALLAHLEVSRTRPHLYRMLFSTPGGDPGALVRAASRAQDEFLGIVAAVVGADDARHYGALLLTGAHGIAGIEMAGHLGTDKWRTTAEDLVATLVELTARR